ncbi:MAG: CPBP family intramembrane metalloprotease [Lachnospiraceae bacterium]|nr:CPBP family intramembrane metalloprotease [Lachnospiraceae bacterium]
MNMRRIGALLKRELKDILRDKKTLFTMVVIPILLYPLLIIGMSVLMSAIMSSQAEKTYLVAFDTDAAVEKEFETIFKENKEDIGYQIEIADVSNYEEALDAEEIDAFVRETGEGAYALNYLSAKDKSATAVSALNSAFDIYRENLREQKIEDAGLDVETLLNPISFQREDLSSTEESVGNLLGSMMPFFIIVSILLGAIYPAIDVTAGEKERGTLETLLTLPVTNFEMIMSKFLAVSVIACVSAMLNVFSMGGAMIFLVSSSMSSMADMNISIHYETFVPGILFTLVVMMFFALLVTAVCMCTCVFAKSFKEANNYATPVMLIFMFGSYVTMIPDIELTAQTAAIPIVNVALMVEGLFQFSYNYGLFAIVLFSNVAYSLLAIMILGKIYNSEAVLFSEGLSSIKLVSKRSDIKEKQMPGFGDVILILCIVLLLIFYIGSYAQIKWGFGGVAIQQAIILLCPLVYAWYIKADWKKLFSVQPPKPLQLLGAVFMGIGAFVGALLIGALLMPVFPDSAEGLTQLDDMLTGVPVYLLVLVVALLPAIGEELLFRGFVMGTLKNKCKPVVTVLVTTLIFAAYHMSLIKMFTIGIVGLGLTLAAYKTGSIAASMCVHFMNNLLSVLISAYPEQLQKVFPVLFKEKLSVSDMLILAAVMIIGMSAGWMLLSMKNRDGLKKSKAE